MARSIQDIHLPRGSKGKRARAGHYLYPAGQRSRCPHHAHCAYTGNESGRCAQCHASESVGCIHQDWGGIPPGSRVCLCRQCDELFASNSAFGAHQNRQGCKDPRKCGLVIITRGEWSMWARPGQRPEDL